MEGKGAGEREREGRGGEDSREDRRGEHLQGQGG